MIPQNERWKCDAHDDRIRQCTVILDWYDQLVNDAAFVYRIGVPVTNVTQLQFNHPARLKRSISVPMMCSFYLSN